MWLSRYVEIIALGWCAAARVKVSVLMSGKLSLAGSARAVVRRRTARRGCTVRSVSLQRLDSASAPSPAIAMWGSSGKYGAGKGKGKPQSVGWDSSWTASTSHGQDKGWSSKGWSEYTGKGPGKSKDAMGSAQSWNANGWMDSTWDPAGQDQKGKGKTRDFVSRLEGRYSFAKALLRPYADEHGNAVYTGPSAAAKNTFDKEQLRQGLDWRNSELVRRPAVGISTISSSLRMLSTCLEAIPDRTSGSETLDSMKKLADLLRDNKGQDFMAACEVLAKERAGNVQPDKLAKAVDTWLSWFRENKSFLASTLPDIVIFASSLYLGGMQALEAVTLGNALMNWSGKVPVTTANETTLLEWQHSPKDLAKLRTFLIAGMDQRRTDSAAWYRQSGLGGDSDEEAAAWGVPDVAKAEKHKKRARSSSSSSSSDSSEKKRKRAKKSKKDKKNKKDRKEKKSKASAEPSRKDPCGKRVSALRKHSPEIVCTEPRIRCYFVTEARGSVGRLSYLK